ncbi:MAG: hypothetical protein JWO53_369 [Chlamydiia bacterium]|nr:hypothetical protein [Chlamydiia bacterium]
MRATDKALIQVQRALKRLEEAGLIIKIPHGNKVYYRANSSHSAFLDLKQILLKTVIFSEKIDKEFAIIKEKITYGFIFGSTAYLEMKRILKAMSLVG